MIRVSALLLFVCLGVSAQNRVPSAFAYERILALVPMTGAGTDADPLRPLFTPKPGEKSEFLSTKYELSDDGKSALVEFVALDRSAFKAILDDKGGSGREKVKVFERGKATKDDVEREFRKVKQGFDLNNATIGRTK